MSKMRTDFESYLSETHHKSQKIENQRLEQMQLASRTAPKALALPDWMRTQKQQSGVAPVAVYLQQFKASVVEALDASQALALPLQQLKESDFASIRRWRLGSASPLLIDIASKSDPYHVLWARSLGADAMILQVYGAPIETLQLGIEWARDLGMSAWLDCSDAADLQVAASLDAFGYILPRALLATAFAQLAESQQRPFWLRWESNADLDCLTQTHGRFGVLLAQN